MTNHAYIRISTKMQNTDAQKHGILDYCNRQKIHNVVFTVDVCSGAVPASKRKLGSLFALLEPNDLLIVAEISRLGRTLLGTITMLDKLKDIPVEVHLIKQNLVLSETGNPTGKLMIAIYGTLAEIERDLIRQRVKEGMASAKAKGIRLGCPKGAYKKLKLDDDKARVWEIMRMKLPLATSARVLEVAPNTLRLWLSRNIEKADYL